MSFVCVNFVNCCVKMPEGEGDAANENGRRGGENVEQVVRECEFLDGLPTLTPFKTDKDPEKLAVLWKRWKRSFNLYLKSKNLTDDGRKQACLLHVAGPDVQDIYFSQVAEGNDKNFDDTIKLLDDYFLPKVNVAFERHKFRQLSQEPGETIDQFVCRLRQASSGCDFTNVDEAIRDQVVDKCVSNALRRKLLEKEQLALADVLKVSRAFEAVDRQAKAIESSHRTTPAAQVNTVSGKQKGQSSAPKSGTSSMSGATGGGNQNRHILCYACGRHGHIASSDRCPAKDKTCSACGEKGHFKVKCPVEYKKKKFQKDKKPKKEVKKSVNYVSDDSGDDYVFSVDCNSSPSCKTNLVVGQVRIDNVLIDSGSDRNILGQSTWKYLKSQGIVCDAKRADKYIYPYESNPLKVLGTFKAQVTCEDTNLSCEAEFTVIERDGRSLLSRGTAEALGVLRVGPNRGDVLAAGPEAENDFIAAYPKLFDGSVGLLKDYELSLHIDENVKPVAQPLRRIPYGLRSKVEKKLDELLSLGIIEEVPDEPTPWISPLVVVPKGDDVRICVDMRRANEAIIRERHPIPTIDDLLSDMNGSSVFSKLDLNMGFHQIQLKKDCRYITTFVTHRAVYRYRRLMFGVSSAPEKYQQIIRGVIAKCGAGVANIADDIVVYGRDVAEHDARLRVVLDRLQEVGLTLNRRKCQFRLDQLTFFGHRLTSDGVSPSDEKVEAIRRAEAPTCVSETRSLLGLLQYCSRFIPDYASAVEPIQRLCRKDVKFEWSCEQQEAFEKLKQYLIEKRTLAYFCVDAKTRVIADASPYALGSVLTQWQGGMWRIVSYASRSLSPVERRYSQTEREALALVFACERFKLYLYGLPFELETDHKPLECIFKPRAKPSARIERWVLRLQAFNFRVVYRPGKTNIADSLSRLNRQHVGGESGRDDICTLVTHTIPVAISMAELEERSREDAELRLLCELIDSGQWDSAGPVVSKYIPVRNELSQWHGIVLRGTRLVIPQCLRARVLDLAHEGHQGIVKTKWRLRSKVWWPGIDREAEKYCRACYACQLVSQATPPEPMARSYPSSPWTDIAVDLMGPLPTGEMLLVAVDYYSRYFEVVVLRSTTSQKLIEVIKPMFARYGVPTSMKTDNGPNLVSQEFDEFLREYGVQHVTSPPLWPQANGEVERQNKTLLKILRIAHSQEKSWRDELVTFLMSYRSTPHTSTGVSPFELMFRRPMRTKLPEMAPTNNVFDEEYTDRDWRNKLSGKTYSDNRRGAVTDPVEVGDLVLVKAEKSHKLSANFDSTPYTVTKREGGEVTVRRNNDGQELRRHTTAVKRLVLDDEPVTGEAELQHQQEKSTGIVAEPVKIVEPEIELRPKRCAGMPSKYNDYDIPEKFKK